MKPPAPVTNAVVIRNLLIRGPLNLRTHSLCWLHADQLCEPFRLRVESDEVLRLFSEDLLQQLSVQGEISHQLLELRVLLAQLPELAQLVRSEARVFLLPHVIRGLANAVLAAHVANLHATLGLVQHPQYLLLRVTAFRHPGPCLAQSHHANTQVLQPGAVRVFWFWINLDHGTATPFRLSENVFDRGWE